MFKNYSFMIKPVRDKRESIVDTLDKPPFRSAEVTQMITPDDITMMVEKVAITITQTYLTIKVAKTICNIVEKIVR